ncbi:MAG: ribonuclease E inhibitor RraB [Pyrinomonadaceae bacterium]
MISRDQLEDFFDHTRAVAKWSIDDICLWGYFFTDPDRAKLLAAAPVLEQMGYRFVGFLEPTPGDDDQKLLFLHVEREERHTVGSLYARNQELYRFAVEFGIETYDGMDVGPLTTG